MDALEAEAIDEGERVPRPGRAPVDAVRGPVGPPKPSWSGAITWNRSARLGRTSRQLAHADTPGSRSVEQDDRRPRARLVQVGRDPSDVDPATGIHVTD